MTDLAIETSALRKVYGVRHRVVAVDGLDLQVPRGGVHALLGPDLSGKSTVLRMLTGLAWPTSGTVSLLGEPLSDGGDALMRVGAVVDEQGFDPRQTVKRNLRMLARLLKVPAERVAEVIERVGLTEYAGVKVGFLSDGEEQRLGIASALLKAPELLILDEPTSGLEPEEVQQVTGLIRELSREMTVLVSTDDLAEVQSLCKTVAILLDGQLLASGKVSNLLSERIARTRVTVSNPRRALQRLQEAGYTATREGDSLVIEGHDHPEQITRVLAEESLYIEDMSVIRPDLQSFFRRLQEGDPVVAPKVSGGKRKKSRKEVGA